MNRIHQILDRWQGEHGSAAAIITHDGRTISYAELADAVDQATSVLRDHGVQGGDRIMILAENSLSTIAFFHAASSLDAWAIPANARMTLPEIQRVLDHARPRAVVCTTDVSEQAVKTAKELGAKTIQAAFGEVAVAAPYESAPEPVDPTAEQVAVLMYTTGTTGAPKGVMMSHANVLFTSKVSSHTRGIGPADTVYLALPMSHVFGLVSTMCATLFAGGTLKLECKFSAEALYQALDMGVTVLPAVPQMHAHLMKYARDRGVTRIEGSKLRYVSSGAAPLDPTWKREAEAFFGLPLQNGYGMTETTAGICMTRSDIGDPDVSVGVPFPGVEVHLANSENTDGVGEILVRGGNVMKGYYKLPDLTNAAFNDEGWFHTGDLGRFDDAGRLHIAGRSKEMIIRSGFNIFPIEVEAALNDHPDVVQSAVVGRKVEGANEEVLAFVQVVKGAKVTPDDLKAHAASVLTAYKRPSIIILTETLPAAATGKILKHKLIETFHKELAETG
ncbi:AMP-binding protein [Roseobacter cerasinus]|uniref:AMP-binding protein n=1 Tax=Roseobacter cerasinus TaxID=2602289 RepID=A0A640VXM7_9RHOB|nr:class I adenylate-forming enzyme family protein [Roseobacter cerasinus]GFE52432.1 AMP-binding protein [Roseobacter cerasinus]